MITRAAAVAMVCFGLASPALAEDLVGTAHVTDGDTIAIHDVRIRLHGIDAQESGQTCFSSAGSQYPCGGRAANYLAELIGQASVRCEPRDTDPYGRTVAVCRAGGRDLNEAMVAAGWALAFRAYSTDYVAAEVAAHAAGLGMWAGPFVAPWDFRKGVTTLAQAPAPTASSSAACCKQCSTGKACGDTCIPADRECHQGPGCACD